MQRCSYCGRDNDEGSANCKECGTPLGSDGANDKAVPDAVRNPRQAMGEELMLQGSLWFGGGLVVTLVSYLAAIGSPFGGHYVVAYGAIIFGIAKFFRGRAAASGTDSEDQAQELLDIAADLENSDRARAIELYEEIARKFPGTQASDEARRNIQTLTHKNESVR